MNKNIFRSRTVIGAVCILLAVLVCFGITPLFNEGLKAQTEAVRVKAEVIPQGTYITADMVEVYTRGASGMEDSVATSLDEVVGLSLIHIWLWRVPYHPEISQKGL